MLMDEIQRVLIAAPVSVLTGWQDELHNNCVPFLPSHHIQVIQINSDMGKKKRLDALKDIFDVRTRVKSVVIISHQLLQAMDEDFALYNWDYVILDEGHVIKNPSTKLNKAMHKLKSRFRLLLTGTPVQNKLEEFWALVDWATSGQCFGSLKSFTTQISEPILKGQHPKASTDQKREASDAIKCLTQMTKPVMLRRKKGTQRQQRLQLPEKKEIVLWIKLSSQQRELYQSYIKTNVHGCTWTTSLSAVEVSTRLMAICRHPLLLEASEKLRLEQRSHAQTCETDAFDALTSRLDGLQIEDSHSFPSQDDRSTNRDHHLFDIIRRVPSVPELMKGSTKLRVFIKMIETLINNDHRVLVFSQSQKILEILQYVLVEFGLASFKIDGTTSLKERQAVVNEFNMVHDDYSGPRVCLLTTKACGVGINLTGADRVIVFDPCKTSTDDQQFV